MTWRARFEALIRELNDHADIEVITTELGAPASDADIAAAEAFLGTRSRAQTDRPAATGMFASDDSDAEDGDGATRATSQSVPARAPAPAPCVATPSSFSCCGAASFVVVVCALFTAV